MPRSSTLIVATLLFLVSCTTTIAPPARVADPETVMLVTHGKSSSLILPDRERRMVRWAFGDWRYYAVGETGLWSTIAAAAWPTPSALGRQVIDPAPVRTDDVVASLGIGIDEAYSIRVERAAVARLQARLESIFESNRETLLYNPGPRLEFVRHPEPYTLVNSSNRKVAEWLRELGCTIEGVPLLSNWKLEDGARAERAAEEPQPVIPRRQNPGGVKRGEESPAYGAVVELRQGIPRRPTPLRGFGGAE